MKRNVLWPLAIIAILSSPMAGAANFTFLEHPSLAGLGPGADGYWNTGDETSTLGFNPLNAATSFISTIAVGFSTGTTETAGPMVFGPNTITDVNVTGEFSAPGFGIFGATFTQALDLGPMATSTVFPDHTLSQSFSLTQTDSAGPSALDVTMTDGRWIRRDIDDPNMVYAGDPNGLANFLFLQPLLPIGWTVFVSGEQTFTYTSPLLLAGVTGTQFANFYSFDPAPVPLPFTLPLMLSGLAVLMFRRRLS